MIFGSICSGIEAASVAWAPLGWQPAFFAEIDKFPCELLRHHYAETPNLGDVTRFRQSGELAVATAVNAHGGAARLPGFRERDFRRPIPSAPMASMKARTGRDGGTPLVAIADTLTSNGDAHSGFRDEKGLIPSVMTLASRGRRDGHNLETRQDGTANAVLTPNGGRGGIGVGAVAFAQNSRDELVESEVMLSLKAGGGKPGQSYPAIRQGWAVRRLTPLECERLQGFPDAYTAIPYRGKPAADGPRYKALGNSMAVNVMRWIGRRIQMVEAIE